jgi:hypothetical protein
VQGHVRPALDAFCHCTSVSTVYRLKAFELIKTK